MLASPFILIFSPIVDLAQNEEVQITATKTLGKLQAPGSVGALAQAARWTNPCATIAQDALTRLLPTLTEAHYGRLPKDATPELCALLLDSNIEMKLKWLILEALGKMGDGRAVEPMQKFAQSAQTPKLRELADSILPVLLARREQENAASTLLRHSSAPPVAASQLLRAASASAATPPELLLRPSAGTDTGEVPPKE